MSISAASVKELRERTGAGMMDCKKALNEANGDMDGAIDWLRKKGLAAAAKKAGRAAAEGLIGVCVKGTTASIIEVNAETDFVGRNEQFQGYVRAISEIATETKGDLEALKTKDYPGSERNVADELTNLISVIGENMNLRRTNTISVSEGVVSSYIHSAIASNLGRIGVLVGVTSSGDQEKLAEFGKQLAMHIAANNPQVLDMADITEAQKAHEREVLKDQVRANLEKVEQFIIATIVPKQPGVLTVKEVNKTQFERKSKALAKKIREELQGKESIEISRIKELALMDEVISQTVDADLDKFINECALNEQPFVMNPKKKVGQVIAEFSEKLGTPVQVSSFVRYELGEGVEKKEENFAEEVAAQLN